MTVLRFALLFVLGISTLAGCRACSSCYDYSPPVAEGVCGTCGNGRAGSILSGGAVAAGEVVYDENQPQMMSEPASESYGSDISPMPVQ